jgi:hypothetical protein
MIHHIKKVKDAHNAVHIANVANNVVQLHAFAALLVASCASSASAILQGCFRISYEELCTTMECVLALIQQLYLLL